MANVTRNFLAGKMNKDLDERLVKNGEYIDALNIRMGSTDDSDIGIIENAKGNNVLTALQFQGNVLSDTAVCIGTFEDGANDTIYWFVTDDAYGSSATTKIDLIVAYNTITSVLSYLVISVNDGGGVDTTLNFSKNHFITGINLIEDLLMFTDDINPPRQINITRQYGVPVAGVDAFSYDDIMVIKRPPVESPSIILTNTEGEDTFLDERFICFAYRYRYNDDQYSATSQFSSPAFVPSPFLFSPQSLLNDGMKNSINTAVINFNSGDKNVKGIDILYKEADSPIIKIVEKLSKSELGYVDNETYQYNFTDSKIFTILPDSEILRLYDNVPDLAKAQTLMGNRLVYGNYTEGKDLVDVNGNDVKLEYETYLSSEEIGFTSLSDSLSDGDYSIDTAQTITDSVVNYDLTNAVGELVAGASVTFLLRFEGNGTFTGGSTPTESTDSINLAFTFTLPSNYSSVYAMASSLEFQERIGTVANIKPVFSSTPSAETSCDGITMTDDFNCRIPNDLTVSGGVVTKFESGVDSAREPIKISTSPSSNVIGLQLPAVRFVDDTTNPTQSAYEYYEITFAEADFQKVGNPTSLHSNRGYETAIVYMDEFNRASAPLVSDSNTIHIPCEGSNEQNKIEVVIPSTQIAPSWATRYKFVVKPDTEEYDTIYSQIFFNDPDSNATYFLLEGENAAKIEEGDRLIVKRDTTGVSNRCVYATVLEKEAKESAFVDTAPSGVYMKINTNDFTAESSENAVIAPGTGFNVAIGADTVPVVQYPMNITNSAGTGSDDYTIPVGSRIVMHYKNKRSGKGGCGRREYQLDKEYIASANYDNMYQWFVGDNIEQTLGDAGIAIPSDIDNVFIDEGQPKEYTAPLIPAGGVPASFVISEDQEKAALGTNYWQFWRETVSNYLSLVVTGTKACGGGSSDDRKSQLYVEFTVYRADELVVFETEPKDSLPDLWYEGSESFAIDATGQHIGNTQNQDVSTGTPAIVLSSIHNCYSFGNGVESYKINDSIKGKTFALGNRAIATENKDYKLSRRHSDLTYSGIYNEESNTNGLNEFNKGLLNFKALEESFGSVQKLFGRETDILVLQEDKVSYVLAGKNLLSDAGAGSALVSTPLVLGTQKARVEDFGISMNPESFASWGADKYFTDSRRGAVLKLSGSGQAESLSVISDMGMKTWFRDLFIEAPNTQKIGGYDPFAKEYVLTSNEVETPIEVDCVGCGFNQTISVQSSTPSSFCVNVGDLVGDMTIDYNVIGNVTGTFDIQVTNNQGVTSTGSVSASGSLVVPKDVVGDDKATVSITSTGSVELDFTFGCPQADEITIVLVTLTDGNENGDTAYNQYRWTDGTFTSPLHSELVTFESGDFTPIASQFQTFTGLQGGGYIPANSASIKMINNSFGGSTFNFDETSDKFMYLRTDTVYDTTIGSLNSLIAASTEATPITAPVAPQTAYSATFGMPSTGSRLYLIWDYRNSTQVDLCFAATKKESCCDC